MAVTGSWQVDTLLLVGTAIYLLYWYLTNTFSYFKARGIPYLQPILVVGLLEVLFKSQADLTKFLYSKFPGEKFFGYFQTRIPTILIKDPGLVKRILVQDFMFFQDRGFPFTETITVSQNLFNLRGDQWRALRYKLTPSFTSGKLKNMLEQFNNCSKGLIDDINRASSFGEAVEARALLLNYSTEVIGNVAFGLDFSRENPQTAEFIEKINDVFKVDFQQRLSVFIIMAFPTSLARLLGLSMFSPKINDYMLNLSKTIKNYRRQKSIKRNDFFQMMLNLQEEEEITKNPSAKTDGGNTLTNQKEVIPRSSQPKIGRKLFTDGGIAAQTFVFLNGGSETISTALSFVMYHIAKDATVQRKLSEEVDSALAKHGGWTHEAMKAMTYLDLVIQETFRMHPILPMLTREVTVPYTIPDTSIVLEKGTMVAIPVAGLQRDPKYYPDPDTFNPDRFADSNYKTSPTFLPFGDGPRACIAMRFSLLEMKVCLSTVIAQYSVELDSKTLDPLTYDSSAFFPKPVGGVWIKFKKRQEMSE